MKPPLSQLRDALERIYQNLLDAEQQAEKVIASVHPQQKQGAINLIHYLALRRENLRSLQDELHNAGLSSLASSESHALRQVQAVLQRLGVNIPAAELCQADAASGTKRLQECAAGLFGKKEPPDIPHRIVTLDGALAGDYAGIEALLAAGMNIARINCAHDTRDEWSKMIAHIRRATQASGRACKIYLDLAGPKIRTTMLGKGLLKGRLKLKVDEQIFLAEEDAVFSSKEKAIGCTLRGVVKDLRPGHRVLFDDGLFGAIVEATDKQKATLRMTRISGPKPRLRAEKGINFPDTALHVHSLTDFDRTIVPFAQEHADLLGFSFVRTAAEVAELQQLLRAGGRTPLPIILKIETVEAVQNLPALLVQGMAEPVFGVMIARGDLAVEIGFERLSEIQEEIMWLCEAAHVPVIWATQVLETLNKSGIATRAEVTDAAQAAQAEAVMLNKGKYLLTVLATLQDILHRSGGHHYKKRYVFRPLKIAERYLDGL